MRTATRIRRAMSKRLGRHGPVSPRFLIPDQTLRDRDPDATFGRRRAGCDTSTRWAAGWQRDPAQVPAAPYPVDDLPEEQLLWLGRS